jgi:hypothetical protein
MKTIVETLEAQHRVIEQEVASFANALEMENLERARLGLDRLETMLLAHIKLENTEFYPAFLARAEGEPVHQTVSLFQQNLARIGEGLLTFFQRWRGPLTPLRLQALRPEWAAALKLLAGRLRDEDKVLHPIHRKLFSH